MALIGCIVSTHRLKAIISLLFTPNSFLQIGYKFHLYLAIDHFEPSIAKLVEIQ